MVSSQYSAVPADEDADLEMHPLTRNRNISLDTFKVNHDSSELWYNVQIKLKNVVLAGLLMFGFFVGVLAARGYDSYDSQPSTNSPVSFSGAVTTLSSAATLMPTNMPVTLAPTLTPTKAVSTSSIDAKTTPLALHPDFAKVGQIIVTRGDDPEAIQVHFSAIEKQTTSDTVCGATVPGGIFSLKFWVKGEKDATIRAVDAVRIGCFVVDVNKTPKLHMFTASFDNLKDGGLYEYEIGQAAAVGISDAGKSLVEKTLFHLGSAGLPGLALDGTALSKESNMQTIVTVGDMDMTNAKLVADGIASEEHFSLFVHLGDGSYASNDGGCYNGDVLPACFWNCPRTDETCEGRTRNRVKTSNIWNKWYEVMESITSTVPFVTTMGNHDNDLHWALKFRPPIPNANKPNVLESDITAQEQAGLTELFGLQNTGNVLDQQVVVNEVLGNPHFFSFDHGLVHIVSLGSEDNPINPYEMLQTNGGENSDENRARFDLHYGIDSPQYKWLVRDLKKAHANRDNVPWIVVYTHRPPYHTSKHHPNCYRHGDWFGCKWRNVYSTIFEEAGVNLVMSGHSHHYARTLPIKDDNKAEQGDPNAPVYIVCGTGGYPISKGWTGNQDWVAFRESAEYGYCKFSLHNSTALEWSFIATDKDGSKKVMDNTVIIQPEHSTRPKVLVLGSD